MITRINTQRTNRGLVAYRSDPRLTSLAMQRAALTVLVLVATLSAASARADRQMDPELRGVLAEVLAPTDCFADRYEQAVWFAAMGPRLSRYVKNEAEREQILHHVHCEAGPAAFFALRRKFRR